MSDIAVAADGKYLTLIARARDALESSRNEIARKDSIITDLSKALAEKNEAAELGAAIRGAGVLYMVAEAAKEMAIEIAPGKRLGPEQLYAFLRASHMIMKKRDPKTKRDYHQPYQDQIDAGRMKLEDRRTNRINIDGSPLVWRVTLITPDGLLYIRRCIEDAMKEGMLDELLAG